MPPDVVFRTKPELAAELLWGPGQHVRHRWITFAEGYGKDPVFLSRLEEAGERYRGEVPQRVRAWRERPVVETPGASGKGRPRQQARVQADQPAPQTAEQLAAALPERAWQRLAFREGTKGVPRAEFARLRVVVERDDLPGPELWLVSERGLAQAAKVKYYRSNAAPDVPVLVMAQGVTRVGRWRIVSCRASRRWGWTPTRCVAGWVGTTT